MYNCTGTDKVDNLYGSTKLHKDITDAINVMVWAAQCSDGKPGYALWRLFHPSVSHIVLRFLHEEGFVGPEDLINAQCVYFDEDMLERLAIRHGVRPHTIYQHPGEAVFIPAGWAHQVRF
jgi:hypothetical protein